MTSDAVKIVFISKHFYPRAGSRTGPQYRWTCGQYRCQYLFTQCCVMDPQRYVLCVKINCTKTLVWVIFQLISLLTFNFYLCRRQLLYKQHPSALGNRRAFDRESGFHDMFRLNDVLSNSSPGLQSIRPQRQWYYRVSIVYYIIA